MKHQRTHSAGHKPAAQETHAQEQGMADMLNANAMGASPLDASSPPVQRRPASGDTLTASSGPNPGQKTSGGGGESAESAAPAVTTPRAHSTKKMRLASIKVPPIPQRIVDRLAEKEDLRQDVYLDSELLPTVGLGHCLTKEESEGVKVGDVYSVAEIEAFAAKDLPVAWAATERQCAQIGITDIDFMEALFHVNFQVGTAWNTEHKKTWALMLAGDWEAAALEVADSKWNAQTANRVADFQAALRKLNPDSAAPKGDGDWKAFKQEQAGSKSKAPKPSTAGGGMPEGEALIIAAQTKLKAMGLYLAKPDGIDGTKTQQAVKAFQAKAGLKPSGKVDPATWAALLGEGRSFLKGSGDSPTKPKEGKATALPKDKTPKGVAAFARAQAEMAHMDNMLDMGTKDLGMEKYWHGQDPESHNCDVIAQSMVEDHMKANPDLYTEFGHMQSEKTKKGNSLHLVWEEGHEEGTKRTQGKKGANLTATLQQDGDEWDLAIRYMVACLNSGVPVMVGVNHTYAYKNASGNPDQSTDHWLTIVGKGQDEKGRYFSYLDPGSTKEWVGSDTKLNRLYQTKDAHIWRDDTKYANADAGSGSYTLVAVALYSQHRNKADFKVGQEAFSRKL